MVSSMNANALTISLTMVALGAGCGGGGAPPGPCTLPGSVTITSAADWGALVASGCEAIEGSLVIQFTQVGDLPEAPALRTIGGSLTVWGNVALTSLRLPALETVGWCPTIESNPALTTVELPAFRTCERLSLMINFNDALGALALPALTALPSGLLIQDNAALASVRLPALRTAGSFFSVSGSDVLTTLEVPELASVPHNFFVGAVPALTTLAAPKLTRVRSFTITSTGVVAPSFPLLTTLDQDLVISGNPALASLDGLGAIATVGAAPVVTPTLRVTDNPALPQCQAEALAARLTGFGGTVTISGNDTSAVCP